MNATNATIVGPTSAIYGSSEGVVLLILVLFISLRIYRGMRGQKFTNRIYLLPIIYIVLTVLTLFTYAPSLLEIAVTLVAIPVGAIAGLKLGESAQIFEKGGVAHYKRSPVIMGIWLVSYVARVLLPIAFPAAIFILFIVGAILAFTSGMLLGETINLRKKYNVHISSKVQR